MPQTVAEFGFTTIALAVGLLATYFALRRWGTDDTSDTLVVLWRRWALGGAKPATRRPQPRKTKPAPRPKAPSAKPAATKPAATKPAATKPAAAKPAAARPRARPRPMRSEARDHVPLGTGKPEGTTDEPAEPKLAFRHRFRRGLRKTREKLGADMRDAFAVAATPESYDRLEEALVAADVGVTTATALTDDLRQHRDITAKAVPKLLKDVMVAQLQPSDRRLRLVRGKVSVWLVCGVNGTGKTTSIAKLAARAKSLGLKVTLAAADTFRAAGIEQLAEWGKRLDVDVIKQKQGADPGAVAFDAIASARANKSDLVIIDTAGRLHTKKPLMDELQKILRVIERDEDAALAECLLVVDATTGQNGIAQARAFGQAASVTGLVLAKLDGTAKGGIAFAVERELSVPVKAVGVGEHQNDLVPFDPETFVDALIGSDGEND
jgi:fused signal recognition particle receptor